MILDAPFPDDARVSNECDELIKRGHEIFLFCLSYKQKFLKEEIYDGIKSVPPKKFTPPVVVEDKKGRLFVLDGDDKLTIFVALGSNLPVKKVNYSGEFNKENLGYYNKAHMNDLSSHAGSIGQGY